MSTTNNVTKIIMVTNAWKRNNIRYVEEKENCGEILFFVEAVTF